MSESAHPVKIISLFICMNEKNKIIVAVIGAGYWGPNLIRNFSVTPNCQVKYVCDLSEERLAIIQRSFSFVTTTTSYEEVLHDAEVDAVIISTPVSTHFSLAIQALHAGKSVFVEKPMAHSVAECKELIDLAERKNLLLAVDHTFLFTGAVEKIKDLIETKELDELYYFDSERINLGLIQSDVNVIWDLAPHDISIMNYLFDGAKPISVFATGTSSITKKHVEMAHITIEFDTGAVGHIHVSWISPLKIRKILIGGKKKMILYNDLEPSEKIKIYDKGVSFDPDPATSFRPLYRAGDVFIPKLDETEALKKEAQHFVQAILQKTPLLSGGSMGLEVVRILEACDRSLVEERKINI